MRILLALDGSNHSAVVRDALIVQAKPTDAEVHLLHVVEPFPIDLAQKLGSRDSPDFAGARLEQREWAKEMLAHTAKMLCSAGFTVTSSVKEGDARTVILEHAESWQADLIMVGSHGRTGLVPFLMGSVSEAVARHAGCSVEIVRSPYLH
jgi:nucleotide-binding universal stress UspA family protein